MVKKDYSSGQYFAEGFKEYILKYFQNKKGFRPKVKQAKDRVIFSIYGDDIYLDFCDVDSRDILEINSSNNKNRPHKKEVYHKKVERTKSGRVSDKVFKRITESFLENLIKEL